MRSPSLVLGLSVSLAAACAGAPPAAPGPPAAPSARSQAPPAPPAPAASAAVPSLAPAPAATASGEPAPPPPAAAVLPLTPLSDAERAALQEIREEPPPPSLMYNNHFVVSNEEEHILWYEAVKDRGGIYVGVGADQSFVLGGWAKAEYLILVDFDRWVTDLNDIHGLVFQLADGPKDIRRFWDFKRYDELRAAIKTRWTEPAEQNRKLSVLSGVRADVKKQLARLERRYERQHLPYFGNDLEQFTHVKTLFAQGRVRAVRGDLTGPHTMQDTARFATRVGRPVRLLYLSNAEDYFAYRDRDFVKNVRALPYDDRSLVLQTRPKPKEFFYYVAQPPAQYLGWIDSGMAASWVELFAYSELPPGADPGTHARVIPPAPPPAQSCLAGEVPGMRCVPGGGFLRGSRRFARERPAERVWLQTFYLDTYEVTVEAYDACVAKGACKEARTLYEDFSRPRQPKVGITWHHADTYCRAQGRQLPTEAQWEKAARTGDGRRYPWGDERATCERAVIETRAGRGCGVKKQGENPDTGRTQEVGTRAPNPYGIYDLSGNAWEWVADWFSESYGKCGAACRGVDPRGPCAGAEACPGHFQRVLRGGSWFWDESYATTTFRHHHYPANEPYHHFGFRCAATLEQAQGLLPAPAP